MEINFRNGCFPGVVLWRRPSVQWMFGKISWDRNARSRNPIGSRFSRHVTGEPWILQLEIFVSILLGFQSHHPREEVGMTGPQKHTDQTTPFTSGGMTGCLGFSSLLDHLFGAWIWKYTPGFVICTSQSPSEQKKLVSFAESLKIYPWTSNWPPFFIVLDVRVYHHPKGSPFTLL